MSSGPIGQAHLTVLLPAYNEASRIAPAIDAIDAFVRVQNLDAEILVVDDGSTDRTTAVAQQALQGKRGRVVTQRHNRGKGFAFRTGMKEAAGRWVLMTDVDLSTPIDCYLRLADAIRDHDLDVAIGSRRVDGANYTQSQLRQFSSGVFNLLVRGLTGLRFSDTQCGFKLFDRTRVLPLIESMKIDGFAFDVEILFLCREFGMKVKEVPIQWSGDGESHIRLLTDPLKMLLEIVRVRWNFRRGFYQPKAAT